MAQMTRKKKTTETKTVAAEDIQKTSVKTDKRLSLAKILKFVGLTLIAFCFAVWCLVVQNKISKISDLQTRQEFLQAELDKAKTVYVFDLERVVASSDLVSIQKDFEKGVADLEKEVAEAKKKISGLKKSKVNADFSDVYMKSLVLKKDELIEKHQKQMDKVTNSINKALAEVAEEKGTSAVYNAKVLAVVSAHVVDISDDVIQKINSQVSEEK